MKICSKCKIEKDLSCFYFKNKKLNTYRNQCKKCELEKKKEYYIANSEKINEKVKLYGYNNKSKRNIYAKEYYSLNKEIIIEKDKKYKEKNKKHIKQIKRKKYIEKSLEIANKKISEGLNYGDWLFYILEFTGNGLHFFKYGITSRDVEHRFNNGYNNFNINVIDTISGDEKYIKALERKTLLETIEDRFIFPEGYKFKGFTECRTNIKDIYENKN